MYHGRITSVEDFMLEVGYCCDLPIALFFIYMCVNLWACVFLWQIIDCLCGHLSLPERKQLALKLGCLIGGISREKVIRVRPIVVKVSYRVLIVRVGNCECHTSLFRVTDVM